ncbi:RDD family protein [Acidovorax sp. SUPP1855]|uniref:RDD family protein n=1 Tax=Acidovorax sp. SUPP1855 TaxID=431774 RepID=UPI0023DE2D0A|nr:RDD family protein [Acidovorax sp. SUPP1855]GKS86978.1 RDD family protein [Acidovorax sp. SUPP1855]
MNTDFGDYPDLVYVGFWARVGATLIDAVLLLMVTMPLLVSIYGWEYFKSERLIAGRADFIISWIFPFVVVVVFWITRQATPGKMVIGARVVDAATGNSLTLGQSIGRYLAYIVSMIPLCLGLFWVGFDGRKQGWHDKLAGTVVVRSKKRGVEAVSFRRPGR